jgi:uncharacterized protein YbaA (DUF1428 family)
MYIDGFVIPVPQNQREAYREMARKCWDFFKECGATRQVESWGDDVPDGKTTDFKRSVNAEAGETVVFSWIEYPSKEVRDATNEKMRSDPRMKEMSRGGMPFDGKRMIFGGFQPFVDERR